MEKLILKTLVGSRANGLARNDSDYDYRGVFLVSTSEILSLGGSKKTTFWIEGDEDNTSYELGHFLHLACQCNPSVLEVLVAPIVEASEEGMELRSLLPYFIDSQKIVAAFCGYSHNQQVKMLDNKDGRRWKYAVAYVRTLINAETLLRTSTFSLLIPEEHLELLLDIKDGAWTEGRVLDWCKKQEEKVKQLANTFKYEQSLGIVNEFF